MSVSKEPRVANDMGDMAKLYDEQKDFAKKGSGLVWWETLGKPAFDRHLSEFYGKSVKIVDLGCGVGRIEDYLRSKNISPHCLTGVEISPDQVVEAQRNIPGATFIEGDITNIDLPVGEFDLAISNMVLEFLNPEQLDQAMSNTFKALKPGGTFFIITTHEDKMRATSGLEEPGVFTVKFPWGGEGPNYYRQLSDFLGAFEKAGFKLEAREDLNLPPEAERLDPEEYKRYMQYAHTRWVFKLVKPAK